MISELPASDSTERHHAMTHDHSALLDQLAEIATLRSGERGLAEVLPEVLRAGLQALIEAEATATIGAGRYERSADRTTVRNGHRPKTISTPAGDVELKIPKLRAGSFFPVLLERRRRIDKALYAVGVFPVDRSISNWSP